MYAAVRPAYHPALIRRALGHVAGGDVVELAAGTGIATAQLVAAGCRPVAVEPLGAMRAILRDALPSVTVLDGTAERTGLPAQCADAVIVAQAFHWFDGPAAMGELNRILRPGGRLICLWNVRDLTVPWVAAVTAVLDRHAGDTPRYATMRWREPIDQHASFSLLDEWSVANPTPTTPDGVLARVRSTSFIAALDEPAWHDVRHELAGVVGELGDAFDYPYRSELQAWRRLPTSPDGAALTPSA